MSAFVNYLLFGATGRQGSAVLSALLSHDKVTVQPSQVYIVTRNPGSATAKRLASRYPGLHVLQGETKDPAALFSKIPETVRRSTALFLNMPDDPAKEIAEAPAFLDAALKADIKHIVYSSVERGPDSDNEPTWVPQFQSKHETELCLKRVVAQSSGNLTYTILRPVSFMEDFQWGFLGKVVANGLRDNLEVGMRFQMVALRDVGRWATEALLYSEDVQLKNKAISLAGDEFTFAEADATFVRQTGQHIPTTFWFLSAFIIYMVPPVNKVFKWWHDRPARVDINSLGARLEPTSFEEWAGMVAKKQN